MTSYKNRLIEALESINEETFWSWVGTWLDKEMVMDTVMNWDEELCETELKVVNLMIKGSLAEKSTYQDEQDKANDV